MAGHQIRIVQQRTIKRLLGEIGRDGHHQRSATARLGWQINPVHRLDATALSSRVNAQYDGYRSIDGVKPDSQAETFFALKTELTHPRWTGVPIYLADVGTAATAQIVERVRQAFLDKEITGVWDWSRDNKFILFTASAPKTGVDIWVLPLGVYLLTPVPPVPT